MRDFWAVCGRICLDVEFHKKVFSLARNDAKFEQLTELETFLRINNNLCLGRWDIIEINRCVTENFAGPNRILVTAAELDPLVTPIRIGLPNPRPLPFPDNHSFCSAVGLTLVDRVFRIMVLRMADDIRTTPVDLVNELSRSIEIHPKISLTPDEAAALLKLVKDKAAQIAAFHDAKWIVPERIACTAGYSPDAEAAYMHVSQPGAIAYLIAHPDKFQELFENRVIQGTTAQRDLFQELHERFLPG